MSQKSPDFAESFPQRILEVLSLFLYACRRSTFFRDAQHAALVLRDEPPSVRALFLQFLRNVEADVSDPFSWAVRSARDADGLDRAAGRPLEPKAEEMDTVVHLLAGLTAPLSTDPNHVAAMSVREDVFRVLHHFFFLVKNSADTTPEAAAKLLADESPHVRSIFADLMESHLSGVNNPFAVVLDGARHMDDLDVENGAHRAPVSPVMEALIGFLAAPPRCPQGCAACGGPRSLPGTLLLCADPWIAARFEVLKDLRMQSLRMLLPQSYLIDLFSGQRGLSKGHLRAYLALSRGRCRAQLEWTRRGANRDALARTVRDGRPPLFDQVIEDVFAWLTLFEFWGDPRSWLLCGSCGCPFRP
jgi:hypothetical protein